jgi:GAF domain-containing protein
MDSINAMVSSMPRPIDASISSSGFEGDEFSILRLSIGIQSHLIGMLSNHQDLQSMLDEVLKEVQTHLKSDACSVYIIDPASGNEDDERIAHMRAALGYHLKGLKNPNDIAFCRVIPAEQVSRKPAEKEKLGLTGWVISTGRSFLAKYATDVTDHPHWRGTYDLLQKPDAPLRLAAFLALPIRDLQGQIIGAIKAEREEGKDAFSVKDQITLEALSRATGRCISYHARAKKGHLSNGGLERAVISWAMETIHEADATEGEMDSFLDIVVRVTAATAQADACSIFLIDEIPSSLAHSQTQRTLTQRAGCGSQELWKGIRSYLLPDKPRLENCRDLENCFPANCTGKKKLPEGERLGLTVWVAVTGKSFVARNFQELHSHCHHRGEFDPINFEAGTQCGAWYGVPLVVGGEIIGVLKIENVATVNALEAPGYSEAVQKRIDILAAEIALSIRRLQIQSANRYKVIIKAMPTLVAILQGGFDLPELVGKVVRETAALFHARACALFLKEGDWLIQPDWAATGWARLGKKMRRYRLISKDAIKDKPQNDKEKVGLTLWIAVKQERFTAKSNLELISHPHHRGVYDPVNFKEVEKCESFMGMPMLLGEGKELVGVLKVETKTHVKAVTPPGTEPQEENDQPLFAYFTEQDELAFELITHVAAIAIQNARLLEPRLLAERVITQPSLDLVFKELHKFIAGREDIFKTLEAAAVIVQDQDSNRSGFIRAFAGLLEPNFNLRILEETLERVSNPLENALAFFLTALKTDSLGQLVNLQSGTQMSELLSGQFFLNESVAFIFDTLAKITGNLESYRSDPLAVKNLTDSRQVLQDRLEASKDLYLFERVISGRILAHWSEILSAEINRTHEIPNPYEAGRPLPPDSTVFFGRDDIFEWIGKYIFSANKRALVLHGGWHTGKTSILRQIEAGPGGKSLRERTNQPVFPVYIDLQGVPAQDTPSFLLALAERISQGLQKLGVDCPIPDPAFFLSSSYYLRAFDAFRDQAVEMVKKCNNGLLVVMLDEFELLNEYVTKKMIDPVVFTILRHNIQHVDNITFILAGRHTLKDMTAEFKNEIFSVAMHKEVGFLTREESIQLIMEPVKKYGLTYTNGAKNRIYQLTAGQPYFIQHLCWYCLDLRNEQVRNRAGGKLPDKSEVKNLLTIDVVQLNKALNIALTNISILDSLWEVEASPIDQKVLKRLAQNGNKQIMSFSEISSLEGLDPAELRESLDMMVIKRWINKQHDGYVYAIELLREWVRRHHM